MEDLNSNVSKESEIRTFAFFDLETTGLPDLEFFKTKITELSIVACSVDEFLHTNLEFPRVQHKLTLCFNPFKRISLESTDVTGLTNELLEFDNKFDKNALSLLKNFLQHLQQPVCLIAHNGNKFDFPLLKKQFETLNETFDDFKCCDSLTVFKKIDDITERKLELLKDNYSLRDWNELKDEGLLINSDDERLQTNSLCLKVDKDKSEVISPKAVIEKLGVLSKKPSSEEVKSLQSINETTPDKPTNPNILQPRFLRPSDHSTMIPEAKKRPLHSKKQLFPSASLPVNIRTHKKSFTLREIYKRFYNSYPKNSHDAESDVVTLLKVACACKLDFFRIVKENCVNFSNIKKF